MKRAMTMGGMFVCTLLLIARVSALMVCPIDAGMTRAGRGYSTTAPMGAGDVMVLISRAMRLMSSWV